ncbi:TPA: DinI-like family protein [Klebsiella variicola]|uniref:DinI-like family protein n=1 Tax=Klebsiella variicola TaxID=244366 RepID=UPI001403C9E0|nr:DinI-like family protein [Klebsiella variicola]
MKVEIIIDRQKKLPDGAVPALEKELLRRLDQNFNNCSLVIRRASSDGLTGRMLARGLRWAAMVKRAI